MNCFISYFANCFNNYFMNYFIYYFIYYYKRYEGVENSYTNQFLIYNCLAIS